MSEKWGNPDISRRGVLKGAAATAAVAAAGTLGATRGVQAASTTVKGYGVTTSQLKDWSIMEKAIGITMEFTGTNADIGTYMRDVISNDLGETHDIFIFDGGTEDILGPQGLLRHGHRGPSEPRALGADVRRLEAHRPAAGQ